MQRVTAMCKGRAYFTTPENLDQYPLMDFLSRKMKTIHQRSVTLPFDSGIQSVLAVESRLNSPLIHRHRRRSQVFSQHFGQFQSLP